MLLGDGSGSFGPQTTFGAGSGPYSVAVGDLNGDGKPDLAVANYNDNNVSVLLNAPEIEVSEGTTNIADGTTTALSFGSTTVGTTVNKTFTIANAGTAELSLSNLVLPTGFSVVGALPATIAPGSSDNLQIQLDASAVGSFSGTISFENNDAEENPFDFQISGKATAAPDPEIEVSEGTTNIADGTTTALSFGSTTVGTTVNKTFTIANAGTAELSLSNLVLPTGFSVVGNLPATIAPGSSDNLQIQLAASAVGSFSGTISFENNDAEENPFDFAVSGTVAAATVPVNPVNIPPASLELPPETEPSSTVEDCSIPPIPEPPAISFNNVVPTQAGSQADNLLIGTAGNDALIGNGGNDTLFGEAGVDTLIGGTGSSAPVGVSDADLIYGNVGGDLLQGSEGQDTIYSGKDSDIASGGEGGDLIYGDVGNDTLMGEEGNDNLFGGTSNPGVTDESGRDLLFGGVGDDFLNGNQGNDSLSGGEGNDTVWGGQNDDLIHGDAGNDLLFGDKGSDSLCGGDGRDTIFGGGRQNPGDAGERDILCGGAEDDFLNGNEDSDKLDGGSGNDTVRGGKDSDTISGGDGADIIWGDLGDDSLIGGAGGDIFVLQSGAGSDVIVDFVSGADALGLAGGLTFGELAITQESGATLIRFEQELLATLENVSSINAADFIAGF